ncbi:hypothetical protein E2C01_072487 [Portunus trituberculatus]|uniref:Uncharacterized protein n=1 Tax=Portunus trituberculatus TaxID=210409 RepID=A0A5B7I7Y7_PORTR|nr:hypothetical protein [Portunus trituberculatus]
MSVQQRCLASTASILFESTHISPTWPTRHCGEGQMEHRGAAWPFKRHHCKQAPPTQAIGPSTAASSRSGLKVHMDHLALTPSIGKIVKDKADLFDILNPSVVVLQI